MNGEEKNTDPSAAEEMTDAIFLRFKNRLQRLQGIALADGNDDDWGRYLGADWALNWASRGELMRLEMWVEQLWEWDGQENQITRESLCKIVDVNAYWRMRRTGNKARQFGRRFAKGFAAAATLMWGTIQTEIYQLYSHVEQKESKISNMPSTSPPPSIADEMKVDAWIQLAVESAARRS